MSRLAQPISMQPWNLPGGIMLALGGTECQPSRTHRRVTETMLKPLHDRVIVLPDKEERTKGGILLPETARERPLHGKVMAVGPGKRLENGSLAPMEVKPDDRVLYAKYSGTEIKVRGEEYMILRQDDILGIVD